MKLFTLIICFCLVSDCYGQKAAFLVQKRVDQVKSILLKNDVQKIVLHRELFQYHDHDFLGSSYKDSIVYGRDQSYLKVSYSDNGDTSKVELADGIFKINNVKYDRYPHFYKDEHLFYAVFQLHHYHDCEVRNDTLVCDHEGNDSQLFFNKEGELERLSSPIREREFSHYKEILGLKYPSKISNKASTLNLTSQLEITKIYLLDKDGEVVASN
ncbi:MAG: hypothetical protein AAF620_16940 [Bacteroidota bacterium]|mgnify:FL=1